MNSQSDHWVSPEIFFVTYIKKSLDQLVAYYIQLFEDFLGNNDPLLSLHNHIMVMTWRTLCFDYTIKLEVDVLMNCIK